jgi:hypothetical protein
VVKVAYEALRTFAPNHPCGPASEGIRLATRSGSAWPKETLSTESDDVMPDLELDPSGRPGLIWDRAGSGIRFTRWSGGAWTALTKASNGDDGALAFDQAGHPVVTYEIGGVGVAVRTGGAWHRTTVYSGPVDAGTSGGPDVVIHPTSGLGRVVIAIAEHSPPIGPEDTGIYVSREQP